MMNMNKIALKAIVREETGKKMRAAAGKNIPAVMYGKDKKPQNLWVDAITFSQLFDQAGTNTVVSLAIDGDKDVNVLIYDFQTDAISNNFTHIDFYLVDMKQEVETEIPLVFVGVSAAVKELGGTLVKNNDVVEVRALPGDLPHEIEVDLTTLKTFDDIILAGDLRVTDKVEILMEDNIPIASVTPPRTEEEMAALDEEVDADVSKIEGVADKDEDNDSEDGKSDKTSDKKE